MARQKRTSPALKKAEQRAAGMQAIDANLDLGNGLTLESYTQKIDHLRSQLALYTTALAQADDLTRKITALEADLNQTSEQMLLSIGGRYGKTSSEYGQAGGTPRGERRRRATTATPVTTESIPTAFISSEPISSIFINDKNTATTNGNGKAATLQN
jgi:hypothetical protein